jgi:hypothetical protein
VPEPLAKILVQPTNLAKSVCVAKFSGIYEIDSPNEVDEIPKKLGVGDYINRIMT